MASLGRRQKRIGVDALQRCSGEIQLLPHPPHEFRIAAQVDARISQREPFEILYFTPSLIGIMNVGDRSASLTGDLSYSGITNLELRLRAGFNIGARLTEFGEKQADARAELRARYFF